MKINIAILLLIVNFAVKAQNYGMKGYNHANADMNSAQKCSLIAANPGYVMASSQWGLASGTTENFYIDRTDEQGAFNGNTFEFQNYYEVFHEPNCSGVSTQVDSIYGLSIVETLLNTPARHYALAGTCELGLFFATLDLGGGVVDQAAYPFPTGSTRITRPIIVESTSTAGIYYIVGSYYNNGFSYMYALMIDDVGNIQFSRTFLPVSDIDLIPMDMIISPYYNEVVVVGRAYGGAGSAGFENRGFFLRLDDSNITWTQCSLYGQTPVFLKKPYDFFSAIALNTTMEGGQPGFIVAGQTDTTAVSNFWTLKLDPLGNTLWNKTVELTLDKGQKVVPVDIIERPSAFYNQHVYYVACTSSLGILVVKLDSTGNYFVPNPPNPVDNASEFIFDNGPSESRPVALSYDNSSSSNDYGLQVMGDYNTGTGNQCFVNAAFNGVTPYISGNPQCLYSYTNTSVTNGSGPTHTSTIGINTQSGLSLCTNISIQKSTYSATNPNLCWGAPSPIADFSFNRPTDVKSINGTRLLVQSYPNPTSGLVSLLFEGADRNVNVSVLLRDAFGRNVAERGSLKINESNIIDLDFSREDLSEGIYFLNITFGSSSVIEKIMFLQDK